jgi:hypothetical protein
MTSYSYELGRLVFDNEKQRFYFRFEFNDGKFVKFPLDKVAPNYKIPTHAEKDRYWDYTIKEIYNKKNNIEVGDIVRLDTHKINLSYTHIQVDGIVYTKTTQFELDRFYSKFYPKSDNAKVFNILKNLKKDLRETKL